MRISKEKLQQLKKRGKSAARGAVAGGKGTLYEGAAGAAAAYAEALLKENFQMAREKPYVGGIALVAVGHMLKKSKRMGNVGAAVCGAGGYSLGLYLKSRRAAGSNASATAPAASAPAVAPAPETQGIYGYPDSNDTGMVFRSSALAA